ncbi:MAG: hypothetical protein JNK12_23550 [Acidimicrobiales bacterium]|nr:hypothetical protein [Acidimicrobiales bacterium]
MALVVALVLLRAAFYALRGAGFFQDDFHFVYDTQVHGWFGSVQGAHKLESRPGMWLHFNVLYGLAGDHPLVLFALVTFLNVVAAVLLYLVLVRLLPGRLPLAVTVVWVAVANHTSLTVWGASSQALMSVLLLLAGVLCLTDGRWLPAALCFAASVLCYQVTIPLAVVAALLVPSARPLTEAARLRVVAAVGLAAVWLITHPTYPTELRVPDVGLLWSAHFGTGLFGTVGPPTWLRDGVAVLVLVGVILCVVAWLRGARSWQEGPSLVLAGLAVWGLGLAYLVSTPDFVDVGDHGWVDRLYAASSLGSAMVLVGIGVFVWRRQRMVALVGAGAFAALCLYGQAVALGSWSDAGQDVVALMDELGRAVEDPGATSFAVGPSLPPRNGVYSLETVSATYALFLAHGDRGGSVFIANHPDEFDFRVREEARVPIEWPAFLDVPVDTLPSLGSIGLADQGPGGLYLDGWAVQPGGRGPADVDVYVDGGDEPWATMTDVDLPREDLELVRGFGADHGFAQVVTGPPLAEGERSVCLRVAGVPGDDAEIGCAAVTVRSEPWVEIVSAEPVADGVQLIGWAIDPDTADPTQVVASVDGGPEVDLGLVANERGDVNGTHPGYGPFHGFDLILPAGPGPHQVCAVGVRPDGSRGRATCVDVPG